MPLRFLPLLLLLACSPRDGVPGSPAALADSLLAVDRAFATMQPETTTVAALARMMADDVVMPAPGGRIVRGRDSAIAVLSSNPANLSSRAHWEPVRAGVSADGRHGFTMGYMTMTGADGAEVPLKYLAYWVREAGEWRVRAYKRAPRPPGAIPTRLFPPALPPRLVSAQDGADLAGLERELMNRERAFSDEARRAGLGPAFAAFGREDAMHFGGPVDTGFVVGARAIAAGVSQGETGPATISWSAEQAIVASSGDLGVNIGFIVPDPDGSGAPPPRYPFFTIWRRDSTAAPWLYVAE